MSPKQFHIEFILPVLTHPQIIILVSEILFSYK